MTVIRVFGEIACTEDERTVTEPVRDQERLYDHSFREVELRSRPAAEVIVSRPDWSKPEPLGPRAAIAFPRL
jgi:hypothetical protein